MAITALDSSVEGGLQGNLGGEMNSVRARLTPHSRSLIFDALNLGRPMTAREISDQTGLPVQQVFQTLSSETPRLVRRTAMADPTGCWLYASAAARPTFLERVAVFFRTLIS